jgi:hypothetical protein
LRQHTGCCCRCCRCCCRCCAAVRVHRQVVACEVAPAACTPPTPLPLKHPPLQTV